MVKPNFDIMDPQNDKFKDECGVLEFSQINQ